MLVRLTGRLNADSSPEVKATLHQLIEAGQLKIIIDLHQVPFIDSSGLASLVSGLRLAREKEGNVALCCIQAQAQTVFRLTMLDRIFTIYPSFDEVKKHLAWCGNADVAITVLIIDDAVHIRRLVARMLEQAGFRTLEASDGLQGLQILKEQQPDIVTCDISMPLMDGYEFLLSARKDPQTHHIPIIVVTAVGQDEEAAKATAMGANAYLTKPFSSSHLIETIHSQVQNSPKNNHN